jgi:riboflavin kinase/FMN adenylyltransferase
MQILHDYRDYTSLQRTSLTIGNFDGLHLGHRRILDDVVQTARSTGTCSMLVTFQPHPLQLLKPHKAPPLINAGSEKTHIIEESGIDMLLVLHFDRALSRLSGSDFVKEILSSALKAKHIFVGKNFVFGHHRTGNVDLLHQLANELDFTVHVIPEVYVRGSRISSTWIRELIQTGRINLANRLLGRYYSLSGPLVTGSGVGRRFLFPTLNLSPGNQVIPQPGVYVTMATFDGRTHQSVTNVGRRPTVSGRGLTIETHVLDTEILTPPGELEISFVHRLRPEQKFDSVDQLRNQIQKDCQQAKVFFRRLARFRACPPMSLPEVHGLGPGETKSLHNE